MRSWIFSFVIVPLTVTLQAETPPSTHPKIMCSAITDQFCEQLWNKDHQGNLQVADGFIVFGDSPKSHLLNQATLIDRRALIKAQHRLPKDIVRRAQPQLRDLEKILAAESETISWLRRYDRWQQQWNQLINDVAQERAMQKNPQIKKTPLSERTQAERMFINKEYFKLFDELTIAKYSGHANWKRVEHFIEEIRAALLEQIAGFPYEESFKKLLEKRVRAVELTLPLVDLDQIDGTRECAESTVNAYYDPSYNKLTVCTGLFNSLQSENAIYLILAHEFSHSIDPASVSMALLADSGARTRALAPLVGLQGQPLACETWGEIVQKMLSAPLKREYRALPYDALAQCFEGGAPLKKAFDPAEIDRQVDEDMVAAMNYYANRNLFSTLLIPSYEKFGHDKANPYYLAPEVFMSELNNKGYNPKVPRNRFIPYAPEIFYQIVNCDFASLQKKETLKQFIESGSSAEKESFLRVSIERTKQLMALISEESYYFCGLYCQEFLRKGMARNVGEKFADWMSFRIFSRFLQSRSTLEEKRSAAALAVVDLCDRPSVRISAGSLLNVEKQFSIAPHPENRDRRLALFNQDIANLLDCVPETKETWGSCHLQ